MVPFMHISADGPFYACQVFLFLSADELLQFMPISVKKNDIDLSRNDGFFGDDLSGLKN